MKFQISFNDTNYSNDKLLIDKLGAYYISTGSDKYPPFEVLEIEVEDFDKLKDILDIIDGELMTYSSAEISFDSPTIFINVY
jgi:hypothetical protein